MDAAHALPSAVAPAYAARSLPLAKDQSHHINEVTRNRKASSLKDMYQYMTVPGMALLAGGMPSPEFFPFETLSASILPTDYMTLNPPRVPKTKKSLLSWLFGEHGPNTSFSIPKYAPNPKDPMAIQLSTSLQYQSATGPPVLAAFLRKYVETVYAPAYADWDVLLDVGATDGWNKVCSMLFEKGDAVLVEEWTYPGAENAYLPLDVEMVALKMDGEGVLPEYMDDVLANWNEEKRGKKRPTVFYTVPTGQNPTGATMMADRKKAVYDVCAKYDIIICEDEPYYCLYTGKYVPRDATPSILEQRQLDVEKKEGKEGNEAFLKALPPTYLKFDTDGRVIRMDTFSKTSCPGSRVGWITSSPIFIERLTRIAEAGTQAPSGFATAMLSKLTTEWGFDGYVRWLRGIKAVYRMRRDWMVDAFADQFHMETGEGNARVLEVLSAGKGVTCYAKPKNGSSSAMWDEKRGLSSGVGKPLVSFIPPTAGMFIFLGVHLTSHPDYHALGTDALMMQLWKQLAENLVLVAPAQMFDAHGVHGIGGEGVGYFRLAYSIATYEQMRTAVATLEKVLRSFMRIDA
ncbi:hypothetical protein Q5752_001606 [Cryptotrichosporon argae]